MTVSLKYAVMERERRFIVNSLPAGVSEIRQIHDRYVAGTRLRLREVRGDDGSVIRKLGQKIRLTDGPDEVACTNLNLKKAEWAALAVRPASSLRKTRHMVRRDGLVVAIDEHEDGTLVAEIDDAGQPTSPMPDWLNVVADVSNDELWTGSNLALEMLQSPTARDPSAERPPAAAWLRQAAPAVASSSGDGDEQWSMPNLRGRGAQ